MKKAAPLITKRSLFSWATAGTLNLQILLVLIVTITVFARVLPLEMQKRVVNEAITLRKMDLLLLYCGIYLVAVVGANCLKYLISMLQTIIGQRALAAMRKDLYHHILTLPLNFFRKTQPGMVVSALVTELGPAGDFAGMAIAVPLINLLTLFAFAGYLIWLNPLLAVVSLSIYPIVLFLVPLLQRRANTANKKRVDTSRTMASKIGEAITGIHEIQGNGAFAIENRKYDSIVDTLLRIRVVWNLYRFGIKILNNLFSSLGPFLIFLLGGYLAMNGRLELGALVAFLSAQEKLYDPWKELIDYYQAYQDASIRYKRTMTYFDTFPDHELDAPDRKPFQLEPRFDVKQMSFLTEGGIPLLSDITFSVSPGEHMALVGFSGSGKSTLAQCLGQLYKYTDGSVSIGQKEISALTKRDIVQNIGFVAQAPFIFSGTIEENLVYSCKARIEPDPDESDTLPSLDDIISVLQQTGLFVDVLRFGLNAILTKDQDEEMIATLIRIRKNFQQDYGELLSGDVEFFDETKYLYHSSIADNLAFGTPVRASFTAANLHKNDYFKAFLNKADLTRPLLGLGAQLAGQIVDILGNLPPDEMFFEQSPLAPDELDDYKTVTAHLKEKRLHQLPEQEREKLLELALRFTPGRHKIVGLPELLENLILEGRAYFKEKISQDDPDAFSFYQMGAYIHSETILNNILFGKPTSGNPAAQERINHSIIQLLIEETLLEDIVQIGMQFEVGSKGDKLSGGQRQKLAIARAFLKKPGILILDEATSALDNRSQARIQNLLETQWKGKSTLIAVVHRLDIIKNYDKIAVMKAGKIGEIGTYESLMAKKGMLYELVGQK